jgi:ATP-dependent helicase/nuclease subunit A
MSNKIPVDNQQRQRALNPTGSFIVQAPAGSGKTELLTQRYLKLLSLVEEPEEILAITFTRKAAAEMRSRIISALISAGSGPRPLEPHLAATRDLACKALKQDKKFGWEILGNPSRLKIRTIDSFCLYLTGRMPVLSGMGGEARVAEDPEILYTEAARNTLLELKKGSRWHDLLALVLLHLDNDWTRAADLITEMLRLREHWLRLVSKATQDLDLKDLLEGYLKLEVKRRLKKVLHLFDRHVGPDRLRVFLGCAAFAACNLTPGSEGSRISALNGLSELPAARLNNLHVWLGIKEILQTKNGSWRSGVDKKIGFPAPSSCKDREFKHLAAEKKEEFKALLQTFQDREDLREALADLDDLPSLNYDDETWEVLFALLLILKMAVAQLHLVMRATGRVDYPEISMAALEALGEPENPSELLLRLDYRIKHILFDEFQDTSISQEEMLTRLVSGWTPGDGRTLFVVGDPMQSIYGFRDADVGVFLKAGQTGIGDVPLESLNLSVNFRSGQDIVCWVNKVFPDVFQETEDYVSGAVRYSPMSAARAESGLVQVHPVIEGDHLDEAQRVIRIISQTRQEHPEDNIAVLVRSRPHLSEIVKALHINGISFQAVEIENLRDRQVVMDLLSLTRAVLRPGDNLAWLCVLRAPWCGLDLKDLSMLSYPGDQRTILEKLRNPEQLTKLSLEGHARLTRLAEILVPAWENRQRRPLSRLVEGIWTALSGPACLKSRQELDDAMAFLDHLQSYEQDRAVEDLPGFEKSLEKLFSKPGPGEDACLQVMTIHKAKGLEFDTVILPGLERPPRNPDRLLLQFAEVPSESSQPDPARLLLAPMASHGKDVHPTYSFIEKLKKTKEVHETGRLIYVAVTRAKKRLHLLSTARLNTSEKSGTFLKAPSSKSLLYPLWAHLEKEFEDAYDPSGPAEPAREQSVARACNMLTRLGRDWVLPAVKARDFPGIIQGPVREVVEEPVTFHWAGDAIRHVGEIVHEFLARIAQDGLDKWEKADIDELLPGIKEGLLRLGVSRLDLDRASGRVARALKNTLSCSTGRWILSSHRPAECEYPLSAFLDGEVERVVIDRTFVDENGTRWVIDYKTSAHEGGGLEAFLDREAERYQGQLQRYMRVFKMMEQRNVRAGLYFPLLGAWREIMEAGNV